MKMKDLCVEERPREKMLSKGADAMSNAELLATVEVKPPRLIISLWMT